MSAQSLGPGRQRPGRRRGRDGFLVAGDLPAAVDWISAFHLPAVALQPAPEYLLRNPLFPA